MDLVKQIEILKEQYDALQQLYIKDVSSLIAERDMWRDKAEGVERVRESSVKRAEANLQQLRHV